MSISEFIAEQIPERQKLLKAIHETIIKKDKTVNAKIGSMMGKEMIMYESEIFKYGLASVKKYMSLHLLPMYASPEIYTKYKELLPDAIFQKGCINFEKAGEMPLKIIEQLIADCSVIDLVSKYKKSKPAKK